MGLAVLLVGSQHGASRQDLSFQRLICLRGADHGDQQVVLHGSPQHPARRL